MNNFRLYLGVILLLISFNASAEGLSTDAKHDTIHSQLLATQMNIQDQMRLVETQQYMNAMIHDEKFDRETYTQGWNSINTNPYGNVVVPDTKKIDVANYSMPCKGYVTSPYGYRPRFRRYHYGTDLKVQVGDTIYAAFDGKVRLTRYERRGYGYYVVVRHENHLETFYAHLSKILVERDQFVKAGEPIALGGNTGRSTGSHLHFETRFMGYAINPAAIFDFENRVTHTDVFLFDKNTYKQARSYSPGKGIVTEESKYKPIAKGLSYRIRKGDTLSKIASKHYVSVSQICKLNGISANTTLAVGRVLKIR